MSTESTPVSQPVMDDLETFLRRYCEDAIAELVTYYSSEQRSIVIDYGDLLRFNADIADELIHSPGRILDGLGEALQTIAPEDVGQAHARVTNLNDHHIYSVGEHSSRDIGSYIAIEGQIAKVTDGKPEMEFAVFECVRCGVKTPVEQHGDEFREPAECNGCERKGPFRIDRERSEFVDHIVIRVQQPPEETRGGQASSIDVHLRDDLAEGGRNVPSFGAGDRVTVTGRFDVGSPDSGRDFEPFLEAEWIEVEETDFEEIDVEEHTEEIEDIANGEYGDPIDAFVDSLAPKIQGYEEEKEAIVLQLFGGNRVKYPDGSIERGDSHILLLGDPGTAKSSLLRAVETIAPRSTYASGKGASASGLTAAAVPDDFGDSKWSLEAGALVLANKGIACVDEIDKMQEDAVQSMHEALEDQRVPVNKAGINTILPAETSLLAAGNPVYGRFDENEAIANQIDLSPTLLSRFDLMFMFDDDPDAEEDREIIDAMVENRRTAIDYMNDDDPDESTLAEIQPAVEPDVMRAYVAYAKQNVTPRVSDEVKTHLQEFVSELRQSTDGETVPVTLRKVEAIERLAEASARARLSETVTMEDARRAVGLVTRSMRDVGVDPESDQFDADLIHTGRSATQHQRVQDVKNAMLRLDDGEGAERSEIVNELDGYQGRKIRKTIQNMLDRADAYRVGEDRVKHISQ